MRPSRAGWWTLGILVLLTLAIPATYVIQPHVERRRMLAALDAADLARRERALNYVIRLAPHDPRVLRGAVAGLDTDNDEAFTQLVAALDVAAVWRRDLVGDDAWLRWIERLVASDDLEARIAAAQQLADLPDLAEDPRVADALAVLASDGDADVRLNALIAAGELKHETTVGRLTSDPEPTIARDAWVLLGLMDPATGFTANWRDAPPAVSDAILWAAVRTNPRAPHPAVAALADPDRRAGAAYALAFTDAPEAHAALLAVAQTPPVLLNEDNQLVIWRCVLALPRPDMARRAYTPLEDALAGWMMDEGPAALGDPIALAATHRAGIEGILRRSDDAYYFEKAMLATVEGQQPPWMHWPLEDSRKSALLRVQTIAVSASPRVEHLRDALGGSDAALRDLACVVAAAMFRPDELERVIGELLVDLDDDAKMAGAVLAGMTGLHLDLLAEREAAEDVFAVRMVQRLGLWLGGRVELNPRDLLLRDDLPRSTVLLAMLHKREYSALDHLLNPRGEVDGGALDLLVTRRWWCVLDRYLPADAPPLWLWADPALQRFQLDVIRCWWLLHRHEEGMARHGQAREDRTPDPRPDGQAVEPPRVQ